MKLSNKIIGCIWDGCAKQIVDGYIYVKMDDIIKIDIGKEDLIMDDEVRRSLPVSFECKVAANGFGKTYSAHEQAKRQVDAMASAREIIPISCIQEHGKEPLAVLSMSHLLKMFFAF